MDEPVYSFAFFKSTNNAYIIIFFANIWCIFINSIIGVLDCVKGENTKKITITEDDVEIHNKENPWYKTIRLFVLGICDTTDPALTTDFVVKFQCDSLQCSDTPVPQPAVSSSLIVKPTNNSNDSVSMDIIDTKSNLNLLGIFPRWTYSLDLDQEKQ